MPVFLPHTRHIHPQTLREFHFLLCEQDAINRIKREHFQILVVVWHVLLFELFDVE